MRYTQTTLKKLEELFGELNYAIRYEKGNFQSGYCIVESRRVAVVNKFFDTEARINCLLDILSNMKYDPASLTEKSREMIGKFRAHINANASEIAAPDLNQLTMDFQDQNNNNLS